MYLKRLDLYGFKSFASRTTFDFGQGITAIVGPNGSGKSNIADALRWVLGGQSNKLIRAKKMEDVIFTGSSKRSRSDKAEVTLTLDNSDGWLPIDSEEVSIRRRGSRSGDSDYYLNGKKAKLRDIHVLLATASVSQSSYAIIGQGLVESVLSLRPEERREMIEEAADIQRYRLKIGEAEDRLKSAHENIQRVKLLIKEIAPRLQQLERQATRAEEHARLSLRLSQSLQVHYEQRWRHAEESLTVARAGHDQAQAEFTQSRVGLETLQKELDDLTKQLDESRKAASAALQDKERLSEAVLEVESRQTIAIERRTILQARQEELGEELAGAEAERERATTFVASEDSERERLEREVAAARKVLAERQGELTTAEQELRDSHVQAADVDAKAHRLQAAAAEMKVRINRLAEAGRALGKEASGLDTRRKSLVTQMGELVRVLRSLRTQDAQFLAENSETGARRQKLDAGVRELREALAEVEAAQHARRGKLEGLEARLAVLSAAQKQAAAEPTEEVMIEGAVGTIFDGLRVPRGLEDAIAAVLQEHLEAFVFERQADAIAAIEGLMAQNGARALTIPIDAVKQVYPLTLLKEKGVLGVAANLVKFPARYEKVMNTLLGRVIVVQDIPTAERLLKRRLGTIVTVDGVVFDQSGVISGGRHVEARGLVIEYERDVAALPKEIERITKTVETTEAEAEGIREKLRAAEGALTELSSEGDQTLDKRVQLQDSVAGRQEKLAQLRGEMRSLMATVANAREQQASYRAQAETLEEERQALIDEAKEAAATAKTLGRADAIFADRRKAFNKNVNEAADALGHVDAELRSLRMQRENAEAALARVEAQASAKGVQLSGIEMEVSTLDESIARDEKELKSARAELEKLLEGLPSREGTHHLEARERDLNSQVLSSQSRLFDAERRTLEAEAEVRKWETETEVLRTRIAEDGLVLTKDGEVRPDKATADVQLPSWMAEAEGEDTGEGRRPPLAGGQHVEPDALAKEIEGLRSQIRALGPVNVEALGDYESLRERHDFLAGQVEDLAGAEQSLKRAITELTALMQRKLETTFKEVAKGFESYFKMFFGGGHARLRLTDPKHPMDSGVDIEARPPGKRTKSLSQLSGGEKALTSVSLLFALLQANPSPFCVLDEVDAMLDEANVDRFASAIHDISQRTQFIVITHNRRTIEVSDSIYGISMAPDAASRVLSMRLADVPVEAVKKPGSQN
ncbi:MAG: chromosome segregation protein SMC [Chloroflexi bacterium]|nr:chromosome segregation protein SMC [Chloroflexota bacterium]MCI0818874.1 chromosome segregation protein SMC [Chloroflexota bacterium]MCI0831400.1 chromosome segregation protein SMC [Chloroflexota bacterium]MCI0838245.1 chromosome segregation protein SMC [Chloroflexota bacterium]MCI0842902.1 chromosome segregation protein SMC [Chloroflexota bacterium]